MNSDLKIKISVYKALIETFSRIMNDRVARALDDEQEDE